MDMTISMGNILTLIAMGLGTAVAWGAIKTKVDVQARKIETLETLVADSQRSQTALDVRLARIEVDVQWIRKTLAGGKAGG